jgi:hypothetical protein
MHEAAVDQQLLLHLLCFWDTQESLFSVLMILIGDNLPGSFRADPIWSKEESNKIFLVINVIESVLGHLP